MAEPTLSGGVISIDAERTPDEMLWYVIQTYTGKEEKVVEMIRRVVPREFYGDCFVVYHEQLMKRQNENRVHIERAFPGYAFITSDDAERLFHCLKYVPAMSKMMADGEFCFLALDPQEAVFLETITDADHVVRLSYVSTDGKDHVLYTAGPLQHCMRRVEKYRFRKRCALIRLKLPGEEKLVRVGILLNDDIRSELAYGKVEAPISVPERYRIAGQTASEGDFADPDLQEGDPVIVSGGALAGTPAIVCGVRRRVVKIGIRLFDRDMVIEVPMEELRRIERKDRDEVVPA